jgi:hypothetical protein
MNRMLRISLVFALSGLDGFIAFELEQTKPSRLYSNLLGQQVRRALQHCWALIRGMLISDQ